MQEKTAQRPEVTVAIQRVLAGVHYNAQKSPPLFSFSSLDPETLTVSFFLLTPDQPGALSFFYEMITRTLLPLHQIEVPLFFSALMENELMACELVVRFQNAGDWEKAKLGTPILQQQIQVGLRSPYHAARILELKGMSIDEKRVWIQERVARIIHRFPERFDYDYFALVQHYFVSAHQEYFRFHELRQISENLSTIYLIRKRLINRMEEDSGKRHLFVKAKKRRVHDPLGTRAMVGVFVGLNFLGDHELFSLKHLRRAIEQLLPDCTLMDESDYLYEDPHHSLHLLYLEVDAETRYAQEILSRELPLMLKGKIERLQRPLFMPRNEEEIMRHVITLGGQLKFARDLPQTILSFYQQTETKLFFTVILARVLLPYSEPVESFLNKLQTLRPKLERVKKIGMIRKKYDKEALVFKAELPLEDFLRDDESVDLYRARHFVLSELESAIGEVRDYNGGMYSKQNEVLNALYTLLEGVGVKYRLLVENFFHALYPVEKRSLLEPALLHKFFLLFLRHFQQHQEVEPFSCCHENEITYILIEVSDDRARDELLKLSEEMDFFTPPVSLQFPVDERFFVGFILLEKGKEFCEKIRFLNPSYL